MTNAPNIIPFRHQAKPTAQRSAGSKRTFVDALAGDIHHKIGVLLQEQDAYQYPAHILRKLRELRVHLGGLV